jgi:hypothetical protein
MVDVQATPVGFVLRGQGAAVTLTDEQAAHVYVHSAN